MKYLKELECPYTDRMKCINFLLAKAVDCDYDDGEEGFRRDAKAFAETKGDKDRETKEIKALCDLIGYKGDPDDDALLKLCVSSAQLRDELDQRSRRTFFDERPELSQGISTGDKDQDSIAKVMRLFYVADLKDLQVKINHILMTTQHFVANPKTNTKLGKVGR